METKQYAEIGSVSTGTMRAEDLIPCFAHEMLALAKRTGSADDSYQTLAKEASDISDFGSDDAAAVLDALFDAMQDFAPPYAYFGAHPGDGADYGFWINGEDVARELDGSGGIVVSDTSEVPADFCGEVLHVNDHGNLTLYWSDLGKLREIWSVV